MAIFKHVSGTGQTYSGNFFILSVALLGKKDYNKKMSLVRSTEESCSPLALRRRMEEIMNKGLKKAAVLGLSTCLMLSSLAGCSGKKDAFDADAAAITVNGETVSAGLVKFMSHFTQANTESFYNMYFGENSLAQPVDENGTTLGDMIREGSVGQLTQMMLAEQKMDEYNISLTDEDKAQIRDAASAFMSANGEEVLERMGATQEIVERYLELCTIQNRMETAMKADVDTEVSDEEAAQRRIQYVLFTAQTEAETEEETESQESGSDETESVTDTEDTQTDTDSADDAGTEAETAALTEEDAPKTQSAEETEAETVPDETETETAVTDEADSEATEAETQEAAETEEETETETEDPAMVAAKEEAFAKASEMIEKVKAGEDFDAAAAAIDEELSSHEMTFGKDSTTVAESLRTATEGVADGTLIEVPVEAATGYYVVKVISQLDREATDEEKEDIIAEREEELVSDLYTEWEEAGEVTLNQELIDQIVFDFSLTPVAETEEETESGTEAVTAESGTEETTEAVTEAVTEKTTETETEVVTEKTTETETETEAETEAKTEKAAEEATETESEAK